MEQRAVLRFFTVRGLNPRQILSELESVYHEDALAPTTIYKWHARFRDGRTELSDDPRSGRPRRSDLAEAISSLSEERSFLSCKLLARHFRIAKATCLRILREDLALQKFNLRWVPHRLDSTQKQNRVTFSRALLEVLRREQQNNFDHVITGDESWFSIHYPNKSVWAGSRGEVPVRIKQTIDTDKCLLSVLWSANGIHSLVDIPKRESDNSSFFCFVVVPSLVEDICSGSRRRSLKGFYVHLDNARPHNSRKSNDCLQGTKARRMPQPAYSPDLTPSDFFLFGFL
jgi:histone-lysine N-methyltransferase SETMAR